MSKYIQYIASHAWRRNPVRLQEFEDAGFACRLCSEPESEQSPLEAHHRTYERLGSEAQGDLTALCRACHQEVTSFLRARKYARTTPYRANVSRIASSAPLIDYTRGD